MTLNSHKHIIGIMIATQGKKFRFVICCFPILAAICFADVLQKREHGVPLSYRCVHILPRSDNKLPVVMLHGLTDTKETWDGIYEIVSAFAGRRVCMYDARNHGNSGWNDTFNVDVLTDDLEFLMNKLKIEKASLVGHSMGGLTAMKFALRHPQKVESIVLEDIAPNSITQEDTKILRAALRAVLDSLVAIPPDADKETAKKAVNEYLIQELGDPLPDYLFKNLHRQNGNWQWKPNFEVFIKGLESADRFVGKMEGRYDGRALFIYGTASPLKVNEQEEQIRKLFPEAEFFDVEGAGHEVHQANKTVYARKLVDFLSSI